MTDQPIWPIPRLMLIYKIFRIAEWEELEKEGQTMGAPVDLADGFIHFSTAAQVRETALRHFAKEDGLIIAAVDAASLGTDLKWEASRGGALFPHLFRALHRTDVKWVSALPLVDGLHQFPDTVS